MTFNARLQWSLLALRLGVFVVMLMWTLDKFVNPEHAAKIFASFYGLEGWGHEVLYVLAAAELLLLMGFVSGFKKRFTYALVLMVHGVSTFSSYAQYLDPFNNLLFFAAWPMLAACAALYLLRDADQKLTVG